MDNKNNDSELNYDIVDNNIVRDFDSEDIEEDRKSEIFNNIMIELSKCKSPYVPPTITIKEVKVEKRFMSSGTLVIAGEWEGGTEEVNYDNE